MMNRCVGVSGLEPEGMAVAVLGGMNNGWRERGKAVAVATPMMCAVASASKVLHEQSGAWGSRG